jgi:hypothetical protein
MLILHTIGAMLFFAMLWAVLQYEGTPGDVLADDDGPSALTNSRSQAHCAEGVPVPTPLAAVRQG